MCTETIWNPPGGGSDFGALLERDFGFTPFYVRYNSGLAIADSGVALSGLLDTLVSEYPVAIEEILFLGYSMGGLVVRSACHVAGRGAGGTASAWLPLVRRAMYVGTPHQGAPLERVGRVVAKVLKAVPDPTTQLIGDLAELRSAGVKDLGNADLRHEDRTRRPRGVSLGDAAHPVPLLASMKHYLVAGTLSLEPHLAQLFGDSIVPVASATDGACDAAATMALPPSHVKILAGAAHVDLPHRPDVYAQLRAWCEEPA
jgi:hypothetical protein